MNGVAWAYGWDGDSAGVARVLASYGDYFRIACDEGEGVARTKASAFRGADAVRPVTGDFVRLEWNPRGDSRVLEVLPRRSAFSRLDPSSGSRRAQTVAVNYDVLFFLMSLNRNFSVRRLERFLALGRGGGGSLAVLLTKRDLADAETLARALAEARAVAGLDVPVHAVSSLTGEGMEALARYARPRRTLAFVGSSGVGKSSLVNALAGEDVMPTCEIRPWDDKGRHATTGRELKLLAGGVLVIDTPGMREIGLAEAARPSPADAFPEIEDLARRCRFSDCRHGTEPGCAVTAARASGDLPEDRWRAYLRLVEETAGGCGERHVSRHRYRK